VGDENDFTPYFTIGVNTTVTVSESLSPGDDVFIVTATDSDVRGHVLNFTLGDFIHSGEGSVDNPFQIAPATGAISVGSGGLDYERAVYYLLTVAVEDSGSPPLANSRGRQPALHTGPPDCWTHHHDDTRCRGHTHLP
jgi:hypothetical protein